jgi:hypothetical protein
MKGGVKMFLAIVFSGLLAGIPTVSMAAGVPSPPSGLSIGAPEPTDIPPIPPTPVGDDGLLTGMTPGNYKIPSGWSLVRATDFEGTKPQGETWEIWNGAVTTTKPHAGSKSIEGTYGGDQADVHWSLSSGYLGNFTELYVSWYEFITSEAKFQDEFFQLWIKKTFSTNSYETIFLDWYWGTNSSGGLDYAANNTKATLYVVSEYRNTDGNIVGTPLMKRQGGKSLVVPLGSWNQWEVHYRQSTGSLTNGFMRIYKNGTLYWSVENANINGSVDMSNSFLQIGGTYTKLLWMTDYPTCTICSGRPGLGNDLCNKVRGRQSFGDPTCKPGGTYNGNDTPHSAFKRYFDDIIVMKK